MGDNASPLVNVNVLVHLGEPIARRPNVLVCSQKKVLVIKTENAAHPTSAAVTEVGPEVPVPHQSASGKQVARVMVMDHVQVLIHANVI